MRKSFVLLLTGLLAVLILSACGQKTQQDIVTGLDEKAKEYTSYKAKAKMTIETGSEPQVYNVEIWHKKPSLYRVYLENPKKDQNQVILRNENGVFVLTPSLNKSFRFQSDWPNNSSQVYLFESLVKDVQNDSDAVFTAKEKKYVFETKTNYQHNKMLPTQEITFNKKDMSPSSVKVMDTDRKVMVKVEFSSFEFNKQFDKESFDEKKNMTLSQMDVATSAKPSDTFAVKTPLELPLGVKLLEEKDISTEDGKRIIFIILFFHIRGNVPFGGAPFIFVFSFLKYGKLLTVPAYTRKGLALTLAAKLHFFMAVRAARVCFSGNRFSASAFTVLAHEHRAAFAVYLQHHFATFRTCRSCDVVVSEGLAAVFDFFYRLVSISLHVFNKDR